jgi:hypothetical protein
MDIDWPSGGESLAMVVDVEGESCPRLFKNAEKQCRAKAANRRRGLASVVY